MATTTTRTRTGRNAIQRPPAERFGVGVRYVVLVGGALLFLLPFYLVLRYGLASETELDSPTLKFFPRHLYWSNLGKLFNDPDVPMLHSLVNSVVISVVQTVLVLLLSGLAGYGLARIPYRHATFVFRLILITLLIPAAATFVPSFVLVSTLGWVSTLRGLVIPGLFQAFATFLFRQYFLGFPKELEEASQIDGAGYWNTFWRVVVPNSGGFVAAIGTITFIGSWNAFLWPLVIAQDPSAWTVQIALSTFLTAQSIDVSQLFVAAAVSIIPLVVMFVFLQRWIVQGVERSGINE